MKAFWSGIAVGAGLGILFAPGSGKDMRKKFLQEINTMLTHYPTGGTSERDD
jgi:gas vesicle protein